MRVALVLCATLLGVLGVCAAAFAAFTKTSSSAFSVSTASLGAPSGLTATASGHDVSLSWTSGTNGTGYRVEGVSNGSSSNCSGVSWSTVGTTAATTYTDTGRYTPQGTWFCYRVLTTRSTNWTSVSGNPTAAANIGFVVTSVTGTNGGTSGTLDQGDTIVFTFSQAVATGTAPSGTNSICSTNAGTIVIGGTATSGACNAGETNNFGTLTGGSTDKNGRFAVTWTWSGGNTVLTATLGAHTAGSFPTISGTFTLNPTTTTTKLQSATGAFHVCDTNTGGGSCLPTLDSSVF